MRAAFVWGKIKLVPINIGVRTLYNILFTVFFVLSTPYYFLRMWRRGNWLAGFGERFGHYDRNLKQALTNRHVLWLHAVSVGEVNVCMQLIRALEPRVPNIKIVVSTTTTTGMAELRRHLPQHISKVYYPIDRRQYVARAFDTVNPEAVILFESEIWPNFLWRARDLRIPVFLANARLSNRSYRGYRRLGFLFRPLFASLAGVSAQNEADAERLRKIGCRPEAVHVVGSLKYDVAKLDGPRRLDVAALLRQVGVPDDALVLVGGSTHAGEELALAEMAQRLRVLFPNLFLVLVPRHFERCREVGRQLHNLGVKFVYRNEIGVKARFPDGQVECLLVNTTGELRFFYERATLVFVGKSLTAVGGQNPIEPGAAGKAMVFGPNMQNFTDIVRNFVAQKAAIQVNNAAELETAVAELLADENRRAELGRNALQVVRENLGTVGRTTDMILENLKGRGVYIAPDK